MIRKMVRIGIAATLTGVLMLAAAPTAAADSPEDLEECLINPDRDPVECAVEFTDDAVGGGVCHSVTGEVIYMDEAVHYRFGDVAIDPINGNYGRFEFVENVGSSFKYRLWGVAMDCSGPF